MAGMGRRSLSGGRQPRVSRTWFETPFAFDRATRIPKGSKANEAFHAMGLSATDAAGKTKNLDVMISEIADKFTNYEDGANKLALAIAIFGRSGQAMIPMLNEGSRGIQELRDETQRINAVIGTDLVEASPPPRRRTKDGH